MKKVNTMTVARAYLNYGHSNATRLYDCYNNYSVAKGNAFIYCVDLMRKYNGHSLRIIGYNSMTFSVGFIGEYEGKPAFFYITANYDRVMLLEDIDKKLSKI